MGKQCQKPCIIATSVIAGIVVVVAIVLMVLYIPRHSKTKHTYYTCDHDVGCTTSTEVTKYVDDDTCGGSCDYPQHWKCDVVKGCLRTDKPSDPFKDSSCGKGCSTRVFGGYFPGWAQYRDPPFTAATLKPIVKDMNYIVFAFYYFKSDTFKLYNPEGVSAKYPGDSELKTILAYKKDNPQLTVLLSIGGWNFHSSFWSNMASTSANRAKFIASCQTFLDMGVDGIDIDWEYPNSPEMDKDIQMAACCCGRTGCEGEATGCPGVCTDESGASVPPNEGTCPNRDNGGNPDDYGNLVLLLKEMRAAFGANKLITIAGLANTTEFAKWHLEEMDKYLDRWHSMNYDYWVSGSADSVLTEPNQPLYYYTSSSGVSGSVEETLDVYTLRGIAAEKIAIGLAYYGRSWWNPDLAEDNKWQQYNQPGQMQKLCCGALKDTYGASMAKGVPLCGSIAFLDIDKDVKSGIAQTYHDVATATDIAFWTSDSTETDLKRGTWCTYSGPDSMKTTMAFANDHKFAGAFSWDLSMDTADMTLSRAALKELYDEQRCGDCPLGFHCDTDRTFECIDCATFCRPSQKCGVDPVCGMGSCGTCTGIDVCKDNGTCVTPCIPDCGTRVCGNDSKCGASCGDCSDPTTTCSDDGQCVPCKSFCAAGQECGPDSKCGLSCGDCSDPTTSCGDTGKCEPCESFCAPDQTCGPNPKCTGESCGECEDGFGCADNVCVDCAGQCGDRTCGLDPVCGKSCGPACPSGQTCKNGQCATPPPIQHVGWCKADNVAAAGGGPNGNESHMNTAAQCYPCNEWQDCPSGFKRQHGCLTGMQYGPYIPPDYKALDCSVPSFDPVPTYGQSFCHPSGNNEVASVDQCVKCGSGLQCSDGNTQCANNVYFKDATGAAVKCMDVVK